MPIFRKKKIDTIAETIKESKEKKACSCEGPKPDVKLSLNKGETCTYSDIESGFFIFRQNLYYKADKKTSAKNVCTGKGFIQDIKETYAEEFDGKSNQVLSKVSVVSCDIKDCFILSEE